MLPCITVKLYKYIFNSVVRSYVQYYYTENNTWPLDLIPGEDTEPAIHSYYIIIASLSTKLLY